MKKWLEEERNKEKRPFEPDEKKTKKNIYQTLYGKIHNESSDKVEISLNVSLL